MIFTSTRRSNLAALAAPLLLASMLAPVPISQAAAFVQPTDGVSYVYYVAEDRTSFGSATLADLERAHAIRRGQEAMLFFRLDGRAYVVRDSAVLRRAGEIFEPQRRLGSQQAVLGARQAELGREQANLGAQRARQVRPNSSQAGEIDRRQSELGRRQDQLGQQQDALGQQQDAAGRVAQQRLRALIADAMRQGLAQPVG